MKIFLFIRPKRSVGSTVPPKFVAFLQASLSKMAGFHYIQPELIDLNFWSKMPIKFTAIKIYDKTVVFMKNNTIKKKYFTYTFIYLTGRA